MNRPNISKENKLFPPPDWWKKNRLPVPIPEYKFHEKRRWRFDYYFPKYKLAIEIEGGIFIRGRHNRPIGFSKDMEKYNTASEMGIAILRYPSVNKIDCDQIRSTMSFLSDCDIMGKR